MSYSLPFVLTKSVTCVDASVPSFISVFWYWNAVSIELFSASIMAAFHAIIPAIFQTGASKKIIELMNYYNQKKGSINESKVSSNSNEL